MKYELIKSENKKAPLVVIPSYENDAKEIVKVVKSLTNKSFSLLLIYELNWNDDLTPYKSKTIFKNGSDFKGEAKLFLDKLTTQIIPSYIKEEDLDSDCNVLCGYSLAGLFCLYSAFNSNYFEKIGSISGSLWYPNFDEYVISHKISESISSLYLSLGDKEKNSKNLVMKTVEDKSLLIYKNLSNRLQNAKFEFNVGNHFQDCALRVAKGIAWLLEN